MAINYLTHDSEKLSTQGGGKGDQRELVKDKTREVEKDQQELVPKTPQIEVEED